MDIFKIDTLQLILIFFVPGLISMKVYDLFIPSGRRDYLKSTLEAVSFGLINFTILHWPIATIHSNDYQKEHPILYYIFFILIVFIAPVIWTLFYRYILSIKFISNHIVHPVDKPWDYVFGNKKSYWVIIHLKDGRRIGGKFDSESFASSFPAQEQIYLQELWKLDENGKFMNKVKQSEGIIISSTEFQSIELFI